MQLWETTFGPGAAIPRETPAAYDGFDRLPIGLEWRAGRAARMAADRDPYTGDVLVEIPLANAADLDEAYRTALRVQVPWAKALPQTRRDVLERAASLLRLRRDEFIDWLIRESGSTRIKANMETQLVHSVLLEAASYPFHVEGTILPAAIAGKESRVHRQPVGVVGVISPWNWPLHLTMRSVAPALALGNGVVLKPASDTPVCGGTLVAKLFEEAGLPRGLLHVVVGAGNDIGDAFVEHPVPRVISFTGSTPVGRRIAERAGRAVKKVCLELGGNTPFLVLRDADLDLAVDAAVYGKFLHQGQICLAINRILVDGSLHDAFVERFVKRTASLSVGDPHLPDTVVGPVINPSQLARIERLVEETIAHGAHAVLRGEKKGLLLWPTVLIGVTNDMPAAQQEIFGPVASIVRVEGDEEAVRVANETEYGLSSAVISRDVARAVAIAKRIEAGMTHVNDSPIDDEPNTAFGGEKASGLGRFGGRWAIEEFTTDHWISVQEERRRYPF